ncbi:hypothetical protein D8B26_002949 [Coccidioides posadasii str. Silveira]|uniref:Uncharacterized protein n=2 Tax=Coccidioides posadasii TaxID=199306 RepID=E9CXQ1_COCPS|nr:conserved hypothetical protein [Coccidioides posadasii str. Silveira]KMM72715.1 hypothetical protein CPAG_09007 [Coccidioides posadasii RMSCC 3488]QVM08256.1 hypothetical protein D8B26_002949 [Coccidioides posadasii str. Silveira]
MANSNHYENDDVQSEHESDIEQPELEQQPQEKPRPPARPGNKPESGRKQAQNNSFPTRQKQPVVQQQPAQPYPYYHNLPPRAEGYRPPVIRESRIKDRPYSKEARDSSMSVRIELDLEVEVDLYARVKGDVTIGLM